MIKDCILIGIATQALTTALLMGIGIITVSVLQQVFVGVLAILALIFLGGGT